MAHKVANPLTAAADASAEEDLRPTTTTLAPWTRTSRRPQTADPERREPMHRLVHAPSSYTFFLDSLSEGQRMRRRRHRHILNVEGFWKPLHKRESKEDVAAARRIKRRVASQQQEKEDGRRLRCYIQRLSQRCRGCRFRGQRGRPCSSRRRRTAAAFDVTSNICCG